MSAAQNTWFSRLSMLNATVGALIGFGVAMHTLSPAEATVWEFFAYPIAGAIIGWLFTSVLIVLGIVG